MTKKNNFTRTLLTMVYVFISKLANATVHQNTLLKINHFFQHCLPISQIASDDESSEESEEEENSATEISTDSEFEHDGMTPTQHEIPEITINDAFVRKTRGDYVEPKKVQVKSRVITSVNGNIVKNNEPSNRKQQQQQTVSVVI